MPIEIIHAKYTNCFTTNYHLELESARSKQGKNEEIIIEWIEKINEERVTLRLGISIFG